MKKTFNKRPMPNHADSLLPGQMITVTIRRIGINGEGVGYYKRKAVFINGALPEEVVRVTVQQIESAYIRGEIAQIIKRSPDRQKPACTVYDQCGGCQLQHLNYPAQLKAKEEIVREAFSRYTGLTNLPIRPMIGMSDPWSYRNKGQLQTGIVKGKVAVGLYSIASHELVDATGCNVQHPEVNRIVQRIRDIIQDLGLSIYQDRAKQDGIRTVVVRINDSGNAQVVLVTSSDELPRADLVVGEIRKRLPSVTSISHNVQPGKTPLIFGEETKTLWGEKLEVKLGKLKFSLSPRAFFQLNPEQTVRLYDEVKKAAQLTGNETVVDAYCGTGTIALWLAPYAKEVRGIESIAEAVEDANENAKLNGIGNAAFYVGKSEDVLTRWAKQKMRPDCVVVDPPRTGCDQKFLAAIARIKPKRFIYVSCNPSTLAKDCRYLLKSGYKINSIQPVDMFPQTSHVECVVSLSPGGLKKS